MDLLPLDILLVVLFLFHFKHVLVEHLLELFIGVVYAELLKSILFENFKAKNIKQTYEFDILSISRVHLLAYALVHSLHQPVEKLGV